MESASVDVTATVLALIALAGTFLSLWFGLKQQQARLVYDKELVILQGRAQHAEDELVEIKKEQAETKQELAAAKLELAETKKELVETRKELVDTKSRVKDLERHNGSLELERNAKADQVRELLEENADLKSQLKRSTTLSTRSNKRKEL